MSVDKYKPHIFILPEDGANRQLAIGFRLELTLLGIDRCKFLMWLAVGGMY